MAMFSSVLIANRGEIACRVVRTAQRLGLRTIAVYSEADVGAMHVSMADEAHLIGPAPVAESYLVQDAILDVARRSGAQCIHPGYGFLSENAEFAEACGKAGLEFVGPPPDAIRAMGLKDAAKALMEKSGVPVVPGYQGDNQDADFLKQKAYEVGYPLLIKAVAGGGGKGMRRVDRHADFADALDACRREAMSAFGEGKVLIEKFVSSPRHIEFQVFADKNGHCVHLFERDCTMQRRHQKVLEESPAPGMSVQMRDAMGAAAVAAAQSVGYVGAGTVEFIADSSNGLRQDAFYFMEMNTRLQVEHPVTEQITGVDLVEWQFRVAAGEDLPAMQDDLSINGHSLEARLYAEDPQADFLPQTGRLARLRWPELRSSVRIDTGVGEGDVISPFYDPMIAKLIVHESNRMQSLATMTRALGALRVAGVQTNADFLARLVSSREFAAGEFDTTYIDGNVSNLTSKIDPLYVPALVGLAWLLSTTNEERTGWGDPWFELGNWALIGTDRSAQLALMVDGVPVDFLLIGSCDKGQLVVSVGDHEHVVNVSHGELQGHTMRCVLDGERYTAQVIADDGGKKLFVLAGGFHAEAFSQDVLNRTGDGSAQSGTIRAPMSGKVILLDVEEGDVVDEGERLAVLEAMKMEHALNATVSGIVTTVNVREGDQVEEAQILIDVMANSISDN